MSHWNIAKYDVKRNRPTSLSYSSPNFDYVIYFTSIFCMVSNWIIISVETDSTHLAGSIPIVMNISVTKQGINVLSKHWSNCVLIREASLICRAWRMVRLDILQWMIKDGIICCHNLLSMSLQLARNGTTKGENCAHCGEVYIVMLMLPIIRSNLSFVIFFKSLKMC